MTLFITLVAFVLLILFVCDRLLAAGQRMLGATNPIIVPAYWQPRSGDRHIGRKPDRK